MVRRDKLVRQLIDIQYDRNDMTLIRGTFRVRGDTLEIFPAYEEIAVRDRVLRRRDRAHRRGRSADRRDADRADSRSTSTRPSTSSPTQEKLRGRDHATFEAELEERLAELEPRARCSRPRGCEQRTMYDLEMLQETGYCSGVENYSMHLSRRRPGEQPCDPDRLLPRRLPDVRRRVAHLAAAGARHVRAATARARTCWSSTASACRRRATTGR